MLLKEEELLKVVGGFAFTATFLNAIARGITTIYNLGRAVGSTIRRIRYGKICSL